jgi:hypothetical protein
MGMANGSFTVTGGHEDAYDEEGGLRLTHASGEQSFSGDIDGLGSVHWLMAYRPDRTARFVGLQRITGTIGGHSGSVVLTAEGEHDGSASRIRWQVVAGSGTGELEGLTGQGGLEAPDGPTGTYHLDYSFDP